MIYTAGRGWIETFRIDTIELNDVLGLRWGVWMSIVLFVLALTYVVVTGRRHRPPHTREESPYLPGREPRTPRRGRVAGGRLASRATAGSDPESRA